MLARLFRRRREPVAVEPLDPRVVSIEVINDTSQELHGSDREAHQHLLFLISRARPATQSNRVSSAVELVSALRRVESLGSASNGGARHPTSMHLFVALALRELDYLIDRMTYDELLQAFGGKADQCIV